MNQLVGIYLPADQFPQLGGRDYPVCLYESREQAEADLPRIRKYHGYRAFIKDTEGSNDQKSG